jgi:hypothetical protein
MTATLANLGLWLPHQAETPAHQTLWENALAWLITQKNQHTIASITLITHVIDDDAHTLPLSLSLHPMIDHVLQINTDPNDRPDHAAWAIANHWLTVYPSASVCSPHPTYFSALARLAGHLKHGLTYLDLKTSCTIKPNCCYCLNNVPTSAYTLPLSPKQSPKKKSVQYLTMDNETAWPPWNNPNEPSAEPCLSKPIKLNNINDFLSCCAKEG